MFETLEVAPPDPILGLTEAFKRDTNQRKINLGVGVYKDDDGDTPILDSVKEAAERLLQTEKTKSYLDIQGTSEYGAAVRDLLLGSEHHLIAAERAVTVHTPGGTGALRVAGDFIHRMFPGARVWLSEPTWANHPKVFQAAGVDVRAYPYFAADTNSLDFESMLAALEGAAAGDVILLHACCHNPSGVDPQTDQWQEIGQLMADRQLLPLVDFAYQGFGDGLREDAAGLLKLCESSKELLIASSFSKNFSLYNERVGALTLIAETKESAQAALSHIKICVRTNYSNPPAHGAGLVTLVLSDKELKQAWEREVAQMRDRINGMRRRFADRLTEVGVSRDFSFITEQRGMFSFSGLSKTQVHRLRDDFSIYAVDSGRINVATMTDQNLDLLCEAIAGVL